MSELTLGAVGDNTVDMYFGAEEATFVGGNAVNVAVQWGLMGLASRYAGAVGADEYGRDIRQTLTDRGVNVDDLIALPGLTATTQVRIEPNGDRFFAKENYEVSAEYCPTAAQLDRLAACDFVHIGMSPFADEIRRELAARGARISQDCDVSDGFDQLEVAFCSAGEEADDVEHFATRALEGGARIVVVTLGADGSVAYDGAEWMRVSAETLPTLVDTTGAGDSYIAGFIAARAAGESIEECMRAGSRRAALTCQHQGGFPQEPKPVRVRT